MLPKEESSSVRNYMFNRLIPYLTDVDSSSRALDTARMIVSWIELCVQDNEGSLSIQPVIPSLSGHCLTYVVPGLRGKRVFAPSAHDPFT